MANIYTPPNRSTNKIGDNNISRSQVWSSGICGGQSGAGFRFSPSTSVSPANLHSPNCSQSPSPIIWGWYNRPEVAAIHPTSNKRSSTRKVFCSQAYFQILTELVISSQSSSTAVSRTPSILSRSESEFLYDWWSSASHFVLAISPLRLTASNFIFQLNIWG
jgi:hypothetical protein